MADAVTVDPSARGGPGLCMGAPLKLGPAQPSPPRQVSPPSQKRPLVKRLSGSRAQKWLLLDYYKEGGCPPPTRQLTPSVRGGRAVGTPTLSQRPWPWPQQPGAGFPGEGSFCRSPGEALDCPPALPHAERLTLMGGPVGRPTAPETP